MKYKILCSDLDGTLLTSKSDVSDFTITEISRIKKHIKVILVSARMPKSMTYLQERMDIEKEPIICYNGALVLNGLIEVSSTTIALNTLQDIHELCEASAIKLGLYYKNEWYVEENSERVEKEIKYTRSYPIFRNTSETLEDWNNRGIGAHKIMFDGDQNYNRHHFP